MYPTRLCLVRAAACLGLLAASATPAAAGHLITLTGAFDGSYSVSFRFDGTNFFVNDQRPLFDLARLDGGSFRTTLFVPDVVPGGSHGPAQYTFDPPTPLTLDQLDPAGAVVHRVGGLLDEADVENRRIPGAEGGHADEVTFFAHASGLGGLDLPPELYGPNQFTDNTLSADFANGNRPLGDLSIPTDAATYLAYSDTQFFVGLDVVNGDPNGVGPYVDVFTSLDYTITGVTVVPEPAGLALLTAGGLLLLCSRLRRTRLHSKPILCVPKP
jgi:hypothetical protein